jgi:hypothetical protein
MPCCVNVGSGIVASDTLVSAAPTALDKALE